MILRALFIYCLFLFSTVSTTAPNSFEITRKADSFEPKEVPWSFTPTIHNSLSKNGTQNFIFIPSITQTQASGLCSATFDLAFQTSAGLLPIYSRKFEVAFPFTAVGADVIKFSGCDLREIFENQPDLTLDSLKLAMNLATGNDTILNYDAIVQDAILDLKTEMYLDPQFFFGTYLFEVPDGVRDMAYIITVNTNKNGNSALDLHDLISSVSLSPADECQHGEAITLNFNTTLVFKYIRPGKWYINFVPERHLTSDPKFISFSVAAADVTASLIDCRHSKFWCKDVDTDINNWSTSEKVGFAFGMTLAGVTILTAILVVVGAFRRLRNQSTGSSSFFAASQSSPRNNEMTSPYDYKQLEDSAQLN